MYALSHFYHPQSGMVTFLVASVCLYVCNTMSFKSFDIESSFLVCGYIFREYGSSLYMKSLGQGQGHRINKSGYMSIIKYTHMQVD